jgi:hypothetical protein
VLPPPNVPHIENVAAEGIFHFPLQVGNEWVFERREPGGGESNWTIAVVGRTAVTPAGYLLKGYYGDSRVLDYGSGGEVMEIDADGQGWPLYRLGNNVEARWKVWFAADPVPCYDGAEAVLASHTEFVSVPAGDFPDSVRVDYETGCADAGPVSEWFAAGVGLVKRVERSLVGEVESVLLRAKAGGISYPDHPSGASLTFPDAHLTPEETAGQPLKAMFRVHSQNSDPIEYRFMGCISATAFLYDEGGTIVRKERIEQGGCCECENLITVALHGETLELPVDLCLNSCEGAPLPLGHYSLKVTLDSLDAPDVKSTATGHFLVAPK